MPQYQVRLHGIRAAMTDTNGGPDREWYAEIDEEWIDPEVIRGVERVTGEMYDEETGTWRRDESPL